MRFSGFLNKVVVYALLCVCLLAGVLSVPSAQAAGGAPDVPCGKWANIKGSLFPDAIAISSVTDDDVWVLSGSRVERWDGSRWKLVPTIDTGDATTAFTAIVALSHTDVWIVGSIKINTITQTLAEHWDGKHFVYVPSPNLTPSSGIGFYSTSLTAITAVPNSNHLFALGSTSAGQLMEYWDSQSWKIVSGAILKQPSLSLNAITALSETDVWVSGSLSAPDNSFTAFTAHWDGHTWKQVPTPSLRGSATLDSLSVIPGTQVLWAVGHFDDPINPFSNTLTEYWNGSNWQYISSPNIAVTNARFETTILKAVVALSPQNVWAVGFAYYAPYTPVIEHWDGKSWQLVPTTGLDPDEQLFAITNIPHTAHLWAVGSGDPGSVTDFYCAH